MKKNLEDFADELFVGGQSYPAPQEIQAGDLKCFIEWVGKHTKCTLPAGMASVVTVS